MAARKKGSRTPPSTNDAFLAGGDERGQGARWGQDEGEEGTAIIGKLVGSKPIKYRDGKEGVALVFSPAVVRTSDGELVAHHVCETIYSAVLAQKIVPTTDKGRIFAIRYDGREKSGHSGRADFKKFTVAVQSIAVLVKQLEEADASELAAEARAQAE